MTAAAGLSQRVRRQNANKSCLLTIAREQLRIAMHRPDGRSWRLLHEGESTSVQQAVVALTAGTTLGGELVSTSTGWTAQVLQGAVRYQVGHAVAFGWPGDLLTGTGQPHELLAAHQTVLLLTCFGSSTGRPTAPVDVHLASAERTD